MDQPILRTLLESVLTRAEADGAYLYRLEEGGEHAVLVGWAGIAPAIEFREPAGQAVLTQFDRAAPIVLHHAAWADPRFARLPEFLAQPFEGVVSAPLHHDGALVGLLNVCRANSTPFAAVELGFLFGLSLPVGALLEADAINERLSRQLADRKLLDRAKGVLQASHSWTEEQAYLHLRRTSRQRRVAMREIAREVVEATHAG